MTPPFFSIIIPTNNRPKLFELSIKSIVNIKYDFKVEVIIVNNSPNIIEYDSIIEKYCINNENLFFKIFKRVSPETMPANWSLGLSSSSGKYLLILTDRSFLIFNALNILYKYIINNNYPDCISWSWGYYNNVSEELFIDSKKFLPESSVFDSEELLKIALSESWGCNPILPRGLNSCISSNLYNKLITNKFEIIDYINPDFALAFNSLIYSKSLHHLNYSLFVSGGTSGSNSLNPRLYVDTLNVNLDKRVLFPFPLTIPAMILSDAFTAFGNYSDINSLFKFKIDIYIKKIIREAVWNMVNINSSEYSLLEVFKLLRFCVARGDKLISIPDAIILFCVSFFVFYFEIIKRKISIFYFTKPFYLQLKKLKNTFFINKNKIVTNNPHEVRIY